MIPEGRPPDPAPTPLIYWGDLSVTGNGDLPFATQRRVESILTPPGENAIFCHPPLRILHPPLLVTLRHPGVIPPPGENAIFGHPPHPNFAPPSSPFDSILESGS